MLSLINMVLKNVVYVLYSMHGYFGYFGTWFYNSGKELRL